MQAEIITIGDEILIGQILDTNSKWIASELNNVGVRLIEARIIADDMDTIVKTIQNFSKKIFPSYILFFKRIVYIIIFTFLRHLIRFDFSIFSVTSSNIRGSC